MVSGEWDFAPAKYLGLLFDETTNIIGTGAWSLLNSYHIGANHARLSNDGFRSVISQDQKFFYVFDKNKSYRAASYETDFDLFYTLRANAIRFKARGYTGTQTDLSCGSNSQISPDGRKLIIPTPGDGSYSCRNYTILIYPN